MDFVWNSLPVGNVIVTYVCIVLIYALFYFVLLRASKRFFSFVALSVSLLFVLVSYTFNLQVVTEIIAMFTACSIGVCLYANVGDLRTFIANPFKVTTAKAANFGLEKIFDSEALYKNVEKAVLLLSEKRVGALITFEKNSSLKDVIKNGVPVHAPFSPELIDTIFYPGTRLHDGAVVVHGNEIVAAAVFFNPTTKPFAVKYGSRHRAAIGISEISDSVTVVVSEETGRISFAVNGELEAVTSENFLKVFENYMSDDNSTASETEEA